MPRQHLGELNIKPIQVATLILSTKYSNLGKLDASEAASS